MSYDIKVENISGYLGTEYSSGDSNKLKSKQFYQEENNNEVNELSKNFSEMGCIVDVVKRPPNICIETCVYEDGDSEHENLDNVNDDVHYSDEFEEEDVSDIEKNEPNQKTVLSNNTSSMEMNKSNAKLTKSQSSISNKPPSVSGRSTDYGSISVPPTRRINMSFTNERLREIERHNHILLNKILSARNKQKSSIPPRDQGLRKPVAPASVHRKMQQRKIDHDNMILLKKIQRAKSTSCSIRR
ncbi:cilia- and flagella-associated protein 97-like [Danaus plexippus]|uniref:Glutamic acid-rich protein n=1 Tax=Danaus plexippus plexippus TaxID=278856 RepID=A0A212FBB4_DANPL|nr:cilia- and flagella-associated protein 97-like [Danaus plexippus]XP_032523110.1 cilia- and flagella-associated protein 97-like [Danaus plexippus]OWR51034.1 putative glutamic acid-rich protein precursor [Danaus plexippus plexippus]